MLAATDKRLHKASLLSSISLSLCLCTGAGIPKEFRFEFLCRAVGSKAIQTGLHVAMLNVYQFLI